MGRTTARMIGALARMVTIGETPRRRAMTYARLTHALETGVAQTMQTPRGPLKILATRGPHLAAAALAFDVEEPETLAWIDGFSPGETLWDIGAATGLLSMYAALGDGARVYAFEPSAASHGVLVEHLALNDLGDKVWPLCIAFSDVTAIDRIRHSSLEPGAAHNSVGGAPNQFGNLASGFRQATLVFSVDDLRRIFALPPPDHIKLDVDGLEGAILRGAADTLPHVKSALIEVEGQNAEFAAERIEAPLRAAGLAEDMSARGAGSGRNRVYRRLHEPVRRAEPPTPSVAARPG